MAKKEWTQKSKHLETLKNEVWCEIITHSLDSGCKHWTKYNGYWFCIRTRKDMQQKHNLYTSRKLRYSLHVAQLCIVSAKASTKTSVERN